MKSGSTLGLVLVFAACGGQQIDNQQGRSAATGATKASAAPTLTPQDSGLPATRIFGISPVDELVVWATATTPDGGGIWLRTKDGGAHWTHGIVPDGVNTQLRDVQGVSENTAYVMGAGTGPAFSKIWRTDDGGATWKLELTDPDATGFFDCIAFWSAGRGILMSDAVTKDGTNWQFPLFRRIGGEGQSPAWQDRRDHAPAAHPGEGAFAASGTCAATQGEHNGWAVTGGGGGFARVLRTTDGGASWTVHDSPISGDGFSGLTTIAFRTAERGIAAGGDLGNPADTTSKNVIRSADGGKSWAFTANRTPFSGAVFGSAYVSGQTLGEDREQESGRFARTIVATGPGGSAFSSDEGDHWTSLAIDAPGYWAVAFASPRAGWLVGNRGRILKISFE